MSEVAPAMKKIVLVVFLLAAAAAGYYYYPRWNGQKPPDNGLKLSGNIEAHEATLSFKVPGRIVKLPIEEGQWLDHPSFGRGPASNGLGGLSGRRAALFAHGAGDTGGQTLRTNVTARSATIFR